VFFVHNRVQSIGAAAAMLERLVPGLRVAVAHGQMDEHALEQTMIDFDAGKYNCLVATTIIESGLDLPNVNTLLINRADQMGLAQLYQLRGRVGRSDHQAYAYLFTPPLTLLNEDAIKRLRTIEEFTELGSGFQIAQRDLEIRGAGNLLGVAQSGNMDELGYDLYMKLIEEAVREIRQDPGGEPAGREKGVECLVDAGTEAFLPGAYVEDESLRVNLYRRLAEFQDPSDLDAFEKELTDRFGAPPREAMNLVNAARLRTLGSRLGMKKILLEGEAMKVFFDESWAERFATPEQLSEHLRSMLSLSPFPARFLSKNGFGIRVQLPRKGDLESAKKVLQSLG
jgi:transcription-repair coupling factor (superfamily II helicase)